MVPTSLQERHNKLPSRGPGRPPMRVLVVNAGSSSLKLRVLAGEQTVTSRELQASSDGFDHTQLHTFLDGVDVDAVGHRVVHGGTAFTEPVLLDDDVVRRQEDLTDLARLHEGRAGGGPPRPCTGNGGRPRQQPGPT